MSPPLHTIPTAIFATLAFLAILLQSKGLAGFALGFAIGGLVVEALIERELKRRG